MASIATPLRRARLLPDGWPAIILLGCFPLWWVLGLGGFIWPLLATFMALILLKQGTVKLPRGFGIWVLFLAWMLASLLQLGEGQGGLVAIHRVSIYLSATLLFIYVYNLPSAAIRSVISSLVWFWAAIVGIGLLALVAPTLEFRSPFETLLPQGLAKNPYIFDLVHVHVAQVHDFLGYPVPRPAGPFAYTNEWGAVLALLSLFLIPAMALRIGRWRRLGPIIALAAIPPLVVSLNRGAWLALGLGLLYALLRLVLRARVGAVAGMLVSISVVGVLVVATPLGGLLEDRLATGHSNEGRLEIYDEVIDEVKLSPMFGYGAPRESERNPNLPLLGTHGGFWLVLFSHGIPAAVFFVGFPLVGFWRTRRARSPIRFWSHVVILVGLIEMPYYGLLPTPIHILMVAMALAWRRDEPDAEKTHLQEQYRLLEVGTPERLNRLPVG
jgi:polysaccharide biosynthesis protein PslJ